MTTTAAVSDPLADLWRHLTSPDTTHLHCFFPSKVTMGGIWTGDNPLDFSLPLLLFQILLITTVTRAAVLLLSPLRLPRYISEILGGFLLGPSVLGRLPHFTDVVFPARSIFVLDSMSLLGLVYYTFTVGVEIELPTITRAGRRSFWFAAASATPPFVIGAGAGYLAISSGPGRVRGGDGLSFPIFLGATFASTAFSVLARNIAELKLAGTDVGQLTLSASLLNDTFAWAGLTVATALSHETENGLVPSLCTLAWGGAMFGVGFLAVRPALLRLAQKAAEGEVVGEVSELSLLIGVMVASLVADAGGTHAIFGAFIFGLAMPNGPVGVALVEKVEDLVVGTLLPLFFAMSGLRTDVAKVTSTSAAALLTVASVAASLLKVAAAVGVAAAFGMSLHDGTSIGLLLNTKGVIELVILNIARNKRIMSDQSFTVLVFMSALTTALVSPLLDMVVKPARRLVFYKRRTVAWPQQEAELRVLACVHVPRDAPAQIALLEIVRSSSPVAVHALHLIEFAGRSSALLLINASAPAAAASSSSSSSSSGQSHVEKQFKHIAHAFMAYEENVAAAGGIATARTMAAVSPYASMHEDITAAAEDQHSALMVLPFHKHRSVDGGMELSHPAIQPLNTTVQACSPCTVAILVDRGLGMSASSSCYRVAALFFGGRDDREALALAARMARNPAVDLAVLRFVKKGRSGSMTASEFDALKERKADDGCLREFRDRASGGGGAAVEYCERGVMNAGEMVSEIRSVDAEGKDLFVVGKTPGLSALTAGMAEWSECPELGPIGDLLASRDFQTTASVLVVQSYGRAAAATAVPGGSSTGTSSMEFAVGEAVLPPAPDSQARPGHPPRRPRQPADLSIG
ncbi:cation/H(+) antiporter 15 [Brachypodium distachyon]|uniref:Uncharacterized protein n=1 Tax=Brachypodium distachyon TaxID=15368 RepID=I1IUX0_BRADI|nr:cation/H(+) antiporter 15 [Brachypodium distachyon]KQJ92501.1 hypothetical protein BRADI_4g44110v3 [Brachypodium distachyon]|eukprot:XP_003577121.1 cation/H(+) antiporter 15 [Brachypodium distachyon]